MRQAKQQAGASGAIRVISGQWRGRKLPVLDAEGLRPTTDRTKETLFNWLMPYVADSRCLDLFAGSGSLGLEALSRHAAHCTFVEKNSSAAKQIERNLATVAAGDENYQVLNNCAQNVLKKFAQPFDLIFIDPPFGENLIANVLNCLSVHSLVSDSGVIYVECELEKANYSVPENWQCIKQKQTKQVSSRLYQNLSNRK